MTTSSLLAAIVADDSNLAFRVLRSSDIDLDKLVEDLATDTPPTGELFSEPAREVVQQAVNEALALGHNYVGCEHLLLALASAADDHAGIALAAQGVDYRSLRRTVNSALIGYAHLRSHSSGANAPDQTARMQQMLGAAIDARIQPLSQRLDALEDAIISGLGHTDPPENSR